LPIFPCLHRGKIGEHDCCGFLGSRQGRDSKGRALFSCRNLGDCACSKKGISTFRSDCPAFQCFTWSNPRQVMSLLTSECCFSGVPATPFLLQGSGAIGFDNGYAHAKKQNQRHKTTPSPDKPNIVPQMRPGLRLRWSVHSQLAARRNPHHLAFSTILNAARLLSPLKGPYFWRRCFVGVIHVVFPPSLRSETSTFIEKLTICKALILTDLGPGIKETR